MPTSTKKSLGEVRELLNSMGCGMVQGLELNWAKSCVTLPAVVVSEVLGRCGGCEPAGGLYLQCKKKALVGKNYCDKCENSCETENRPENGIYSERINPPKDRFPNGWRTESGKAAISWMCHLNKQGLSREDGEDILRKHNIEKLQEEEWVMKEKGRRGRRVSTVSDSSSDGGNAKDDETSRFLPLDGIRKSPPASNAHIGTNGKKLRVAKNKTTGSVRKVFIDNWTDAAHLKFSEMYCGGETGKDVGQEVVKKSKKKVDQLAEMQAALAAMAEENAKLRCQAAASIPSAPESKVQQLPVPSDDENLPGDDGLSQELRWHQKRSETHQSWQWLRRPLNLFLQTLVPFVRCETPRPPRAPATKI